MTEESQPNSKNYINMRATANDGSTLNQIGHLEAGVVNISLKHKELLELLEASSKAELVGIKAGDPPKSLAHWQGRDEEIAQLRQWLSSGVILIGIEGIGGTGKSTLAAKIYEEIDIFPKRYWADVSTGAIFSELARQVLTEFGCRVPEDESQLVTALVKCLRSGQYLLVIDNLESLLQDDGQWQSQFYEEFFQAWLEYGSDSKVLVTTRERLTLRGFEWLPLKGLKNPDGVALLAELGIQGDLEAFTKLVDGHPLLLKLVADLLKDECSQDPCLDRLADLGLGNLQQLLTDPKVVGQHRRENVGMVLVLDASFERLSVSQKTLLQKVSVYRGAFHRAAVAALLSLGSEAEVEGELRRLVKRSLLQVKLDGKQQFEFQPVVLEYVRHKAGDQTEAHQQAITYYRSIAKEQPWQTIDDVKEYLEIFYHYCRLGDYDSAFDTIETCDDFLTLRGYYTVQLEAYGQLVGVWEKTGERENGKYWVALFSLGNAHESLGQYPQAIDFFQQSLIIARDIGDRRREAYSLNNLGNAHDSVGQYPQAIDFLQQSLAIKRDIGDRKGEACSLNNLGNAHDSVGQYPQAIDFYQQSLAIKRNIGDRNGEAYSLNNLGNTYNSLGQYPQAIDFLQQSLAIARDIGDRGGEAYSLNNLGNAHNSLGQYPQAIDFLQQSLAIARDIGNRHGETHSLLGLGNTYNSLGQYPQAIDFLQQSLAIARDIGDRHGETHSLIGLGNTYNSLGQYPQATDFLQQSLAIARDIGDRDGEARGWLNLGLTLENVNRESDAISAYRNARELYQAGSDTNIQACNKAIERLSPSQLPVAKRRGFWQWLSRLWRWLKRLWQ